MPCSNSAFNSGNPPPRLIFFEFLPEIGRTADSFEEVPLALSAFFNRVDLFLCPPAASLALPPFDLFKLCLRIGYLSKSAAPFSAHILFFSFPGGAWEPEEGKFLPSFFLHNRPLVVANVGRIRVGVRPEITQRHQRLAAGVDEFHALTRRLMADKDLVLGQFAEADHRGCL